MKNKFLILSLLLFSVFLIPGNVFADSIKVQFEDYSLNFTEEERQKAIDTILSDTILNNYSKDNYYYTILYTASYKDITINSVDDELQKRSTYILLISPKSWSNGRSLLINSSKRFDISASDAYYFDSDFINLGEHTGSIYHYLDISKNTDNYSISFPLLYTSSDIIYNGSGYDFDYYNGDTLIFSLLKRENYLEKYNKYTPPIKYTINSIHKISTIILGEDIPEKFSFIYLITDYLLLLAFVIVVISPFVLIVRILRWS